MTPPMVVERVLAAQGLARSAMNEIREVIFGRFRGGQIELPQALREAIEDVQAGTRLQAKLRVIGHTQPVSAGTQHARVQAAREALFNVVRHAEARHVWVTLRWRPQLYQSRSLTTARATTASSNSGSSSRHPRAIISG
jgi:signal transduction histidine kinase